jgi:hypothetical protein
MSCTECEIRPAGVFARLERTRIWRRSLRTILCCVRHPLRTGGRNTDSRSFSIGVLNVARSGITLNRISPSKGSGRNTYQSRMVAGRHCVFT